MSPTPRHHRSGCPGTMSLSLSSRTAMLMLLLFLLHQQHGSLSVMGRPDGGIRSAQPASSSSLSRARIVADDDDYTSFSSHGFGGGAGGFGDGLWIPQSHLGVLDDTDESRLFPTSDDDPDGSSVGGRLSVIPKSLRLHSPAAAAAREERAEPDENDVITAGGDNNQMKKQRDWRSAAVTVTKTGTTIVGVRTSQGVVLAADTRATEGSLVADMTCEKLQPLSENAAAAGAGTAADLYHVTRACRFSGRLHMVATGVTSVGLEYLCRFLQQYLYDHGETTSVYLIVGGFLSDGVTPCLRELYPHGSSNDAAYAALGSGGMAALSVLEHGYNPNLSLHDAIDLAVTAVTAGIRHDLGSGSQVDLCVLRPHQQPAAFSRAVVPAETLPELPLPLWSSSSSAAALTRSNEEAAKAADADASRVAKTDTSSNNNNVVVPRGGVNGFGNVDFVIRSRKQLCLSQSIQAQQILEQWKDVLPKDE